MSSTILTIIRGDETVKINLSAVTMVTRTMAGTTPSVHVYFQDFRYSFIGETAEAFMQRYDEWVASATGTPLYASVAHEPKELGMLDGMMGIRISKGTYDAMCAALRASWNLVSEISTAEDARIQRDITTACELIDSGLLHPSRWGYEVHPAPFAIYAAIAALREEMGVDLADSEEEE